MCILPAAYVTVKATPVNATDVQSYKINNNNQLLAMILTGEKRLAGFDDFDVFKRTLPQSRVHSGWR